MTNPDDRPSESIRRTAALQRGASNSTPAEQRPARWYSRGYIPHFDAPHAIQHIIYRLADALPKAVLERLKDEVSKTDPHLAVLHDRIEDWLDSGHGSCLLREPAAASCVENAWKHFDGERYRLLTWVVMPNHCHVLIETFEAFSVAKIVMSWKSFTARRIKAWAIEDGRKWPGPSDPVWQRDYWDRFIRNQEHLETAVRYIEGNPVKAGLTKYPEEWPWSSAFARQP